MPHTHPRFYLTVSVRLLVCLVRYVGQLDSEKPGHLYPGWDPNRDKTSKW